MANKKVKNNNAKSSKMDRATEECPSLISFNDLTYENLKNIVLKNRYVQILICLIIIGFGLRFYHLGFNSIWLDEGTTLGYARTGFIQIWSSVMAEFHPPLFYWIEHIMMAFGESEFSLRFMPAVFGILAIPVFYLIGSEIVNREVGIISALLVTISPFQIYYSQDARAYTMILLFFSISLLCYIYALKSKDFKWWILFGLTSAIAFWAHYYTIIGTGVLILHAVITQYKEMKENSILWKSIIVGIFVFIIASIPLLSVLYQRYLALSANPPTYGVLGLPLITETLNSFSGYNWFITLLFVIIFVIGVIYLFRKNFSDSILVIGLLILPIIISVILSAKITMNPRYLIFILPAYYIGVASGYVPISSLIKKKKFIYIFMAFLVLINVPFLADYYTGYTKNDWRGFSDDLEGITASGDVLVVIPGYMNQPLNYYYSNVSDKTIELSASSADTLENIRNNYENTTVYYIMTWDIMAADPQGGTINWLENNAELLGQNMGIYLLRLKTA